MTTPTLDALRALVQKWRAEGAHKDTFHATMGIGWKSCADDLEAILSAALASASTPAREQIEQALTPEVRRLAHDARESVLSGVTGIGDRNREEVAHAEWAAIISRAIVAAPPRAPETPRATKEQRAKYEERRANYEACVRSHHLGCTCGLDGFLFAPAPLASEQELLRLGERASRWFADGTRADEPLDVETAVKCIDGALGALEASGAQETARTCYTCVWVYEQVCRQLAEPASDDQAVLTDIATKIEESTALPTPPPASESRT